MPRFIYVVDRKRRDLYERLTSDFAGHDDVLVVLDRRRGERRLAPRAVGADLRRSDRRGQGELEVELRSEGVFLTACADPDHVLILVS